MADKKYKEKFEQKVKLMLSRTIRSRTAEYPTPRSVYAGLLDQLVEEAVTDRKAHFEVDRISRGWKKFLAKNPFIEVTLQSANFFELNFPKKAASTIPETWVKSGKRLVKVPVTERLRLIAWIEEFFQIQSQGNQKSIMVGWVEGP